MKKRSTAIIITGGLSLAAFAMGISPSMAQPITPLDNATLVPAISQPQTGEDLNVANSLPRQLAAEFDRSTVRVVAQNALGRYSVALDATGQQVCVISQPTGKSGLVGASCLPKQEFVQRGVSVGVQENGTSVRTTEAYLLPGDVDTAPLRAMATPSGALTGRDTAHIIVQTGNTTLPQQVELGRSNSAVKFQFNTIIRPFKEGVVSPDIR